MLRPGWAIERGMHSAARGVSDMRAGRLCPSVDALPKGCTATRDVSIVVGALENGYVSFLDLS